MSGLTIKQVLVFGAGTFLMVATGFAFASDATTFKSQDQVLVKSGKEYRAATVLTNNNDGTLAIKMLNSPGYVFSQPVEEVMPLKSIRELTIPSWYGLNSRTLRVGDRIRTKCMGRIFSAEIRDLTSDGLALIVFDGLHWEVQHACDAYVKASTL